MPATNAVSERSLASQDLPAFNHGRGQVQPPHASACPRGIGRWYWHGGRPYSHRGEMKDSDERLIWWRSPICLWGTTSGASTCFGSFQQTTCRWSLCLPLRQLRQFLRTYYYDIESWNISWFQDTETVGFLFCNWRCKCYTLFNVHWFTETV